MNSENLYSQDSYIQLIQNLLDKGLSWHYFEECTPAGPPTALEILQDNKVLQVKLTDQRSIELATEEGEIVSQDSKSYFINKDSLLRGWEHFRHNHMNENPEEINIQTFDWSDFMQVITLGTVIW